MGAIAERLNLPLAMVKNHLRVDLDEDDVLIQDYIASAIEEAESFLNNDFERQVERVSVRGDGTTVEFQLGSYPVFKVHWIKTGIYYYGLDTLTSDYSVDKATGIITFNRAPDSGDLIEVDYEAEFPVPTRVRNWILNRVSYKYEHRTHAVSQQGDTSGQVTWSKPDFTEIWQLRKNPGF